MNKAPVKWYDTTVGGFVLVFFVAPIGLMAAWFAIIWAIWRVLTWLSQ